MIEPKQSATTDQHDAEFKEQLEQFAHILVEVYLSLTPEQRAKYSKEK